MRNVALVLGGSGVVGRSVIDHLRALKTWKVISVSRRKLNNLTDVEFLSVDLTDRDACEETLSQLTDVTHVIYAALLEQPSLVSGWSDSEHVNVNVAMLKNVMQVVDKSAPHLKHVTLLQGAKAYGVHLGPLPTLPAKEKHVRHMPPNFYFDQEDFVKALQQGKAWSWTVLRPPAVCGFAVGSPMNAIAGIGVFAAISRELGLPLRFPGTAYVGEVCDARLLARAITWAGGTSSAQNEIFNVTNGDCFVWKDVWPLIAKTFKMEHADPQHMALASVMPDKTAVWDQIVEKHNLKPNAYDALVPSWEFIDFMLRFNRPSNPVLMSTIKIRQAGFGDCVDTEEMIAELLRNLQQERVLPF